MRQLPCPEMGPVSPIMLLLMAFSQLMLSTMVPIRTCCPMMVRKAAPKGILLILGALGESIFQSLITLVKLKLNRFQGNKYWKIIV